MGTLSKLATPQQRLNSWKEIATFFDCDERTVRRWEKDRGLPVHRLPGNSGGKVFAYADELGQWLKVPEPAAQESLRLIVPPVLKIEPEPRAFFASPSATVASRKPLLLIPLIFMAALGAWLISHGYRLARADLAGGAKFSAAPEPHHPVPEAEELYLKGLYYWNQRTPEGLNKAVDFFTQAIVRDPADAQAYAGLADCYDLLREYTIMPDSEAYPRALAAARKAVELDDNLADAHASLGFTHFYWGWDAVSANREFRRALQLDPNNVTAHHWYATVLSAVGRQDEALAEIERARKLDPASTSILADKGLLLFNAGRRQQAITLLQQMERTQPEFMSPHRYLSDIYLVIGDYSGYVDESKKTAQLIHDKLGLALAASAGKGLAQNGSRGMLEALLKAQKGYRPGVVSPYQLAKTCALLGRKREALQYLKVAYDKHDETFTYLATDPALVSLHEEPEYRGLLAHTGFQPTS